MKMFKRSLMSDVFSRNMGLEEDLSKYRDLEKKENEAFAEWHENPSKDRAEKVKQLYQEKKIVAKKMWELL